MTSDAKRNARRRRITCGDKQAEASVLLHGELRMMRRLSLHAPCLVLFNLADYRQPSLRAAYAGHFLPYIARQLEREDALAAAGLPLGGSGPPSDVLSNPALLRAFYEDAAARDTSDLFNARALERYKRRLSGTSDQPHAVAP